MRATADLSGTILKLPSVWRMRVAGSSSRSILYKIWIASVDGVVVYLWFCCSEAKSWGFKVNKQGPLPTTKKGCKGNLNIPCGRTTWRYGCSSNLGAALTTCISIKQFHVATSIFLFLKNTKFEKKVLKMSGGLPCKYKNGSRNIGYPAPYSFQSISLCISPGISDANKPGYTRCRGRWKVSFAQRIKRWKNCEISSLMRCQPVEACRTASSQSTVWERGRTCWRADTVQLRMGLFILHFWFLWPVSNWTRDWSNRILDMNNKREFVSSQTYSAHPPNGEENVFTTWPLETTN